MTSLTTLKEGFLGLRMSVRLWPRSSDINAVRLPCEMVLSEKNTAILYVKFIFAQFILFTISSCFNTFKLTLFSDHWPCDIIPYMVLAITLNLYIYLCSQEAYPLFNQYFYYQ